MIKEYGEVIIAADRVVVTGFTFDGVNQEQAAREAVEWAKARLNEEEPEGGTDR